jgi:hypothetical protein
VSVGRDASVADGFDGGKIDVVVACNAASCPTGCCNNQNQCVTSPNNGACGSGGAACQQCAAGQECNGNATARHACAQRVRARRDVVTARRACRMAVRRTPNPVRPARRAVLVQPRSRATTRRANAFATPRRVRRDAAAAISVCPMRARATQRVERAARRGSCNRTQKCDGSGSCVAKTWCEMQTQPRRERGA